MKKFDIPSFYKSPIISSIKEMRREADKMKKDFEPSVLDFGPIRFLIARHFGFCYGVENAIEIIYKTIQEHSDKRIFLLSEMIHNPQVNQDLQDQGVRFIMDTHGNELISWDNINSDDIVVIPAFGTTVEIESILKLKNIQVEKYNTTCPFVERVWKRSEKLGSDNYTIVIHGKKNHEETKATFSHSKENAPAIVIQNLEEAKKLGEFIEGKHPKDEFFTVFEGRYSSGFDPEIHLKNMGVVNQTTMLATDTQEIADYLKEITLKANTENSFADTRDTLCYATSDNQNAVYGLLKKEADLAIVVGGYNSSNTSHLVELCEEQFTTYHICDANEIVSKTEIKHFKFRTKSNTITKEYLPEKEKLTIALTSGASCPDATVEAVIQKLINFYSNSKPIDEALNSADLINF